MFGLSSRRLAPEEMDDPSLDKDHLYDALSGLRRLNFVSRSARLGWGPIRYLAERVKRPLRVLDIATGFGDVPIALWRRAKRAGYSLDVHGIDVNPFSVEFARENAAAAKAPITFECRSAIEDDLPAGFDVVMCSLFLHHLTEGDAVLLLRRMAAAARCMGMVNDLRRCWHGLCLAYGVSRLLSRSSVVHHDAVRSVRAAFTTDELAQLVEKANTPPGKISKHWPARTLLVWYTPQWSSHRVVDLCDGGDPQIQAEFS